MKKDDRIKDLEERLAAARKDSAHKDATIKYLCESIDATKKDSLDKGVRIKYLEKMLAAAREASGNNDTLNKYTEDMILALVRDGLKKDHRAKYLEEERLVTEEDKRELEDTLESLNSGYESLEVAAEEYFTDLHDTKDKQGKGRAVRSQKFKDKDKLFLTYLPRFNKLVQHNIEVDLMAGRTAVVAARKTVREEIFAKYDLEMGYKKALKLFPPPSK
jgi:hypothetical protein